MKIGSVPHETARKHTKEPLSWKSDARINPLTTECKNQPQTWLQLTKKKSQSNAQQQVG